MIDSSVIKGPCSKDVGLEVSLVLITFSTTFSTGVFSVYSKSKKLVATASSKSLSGKPSSVLSDTSSLTLVNISVCTASLKKESS
jgi:hypothetical protein